MLKLNNTLQRALVVCLALAVLPVCGPEPAGTIAAQSSLSGTKTRTLKGVVVDENGEPLIGAGVLLPSGKDGVTTGDDGSFSIQVPLTGIVLKFSYIGYETVSITIDSNTQDLRVQLKPDNTLEEASISAGYGVIQKRENFAGSAFEIKGEELQFRPHDRLDNMLAGMVPGMMVEESSVNGARTYISIRIRGDGSLSASNEPLWVIDGVPVYTGTKSGAVVGTSASVSPLSYINPDDIENITVLKDASTTTLYGADGSNGVILVTTRTAKAGNNQFKASIRYGIDTIDKSTRIKYLSADQWFDIAKFAWTNSGRDLGKFPWQDNEYQTYTGVNTDWFNVYTGTGSTFETNLSATGGTEKMKHYLSAGVYTQNSPVIGNKQKRFTLRERTTFHIGSKLKAELIFAGTYQHTDIFSISAYSNYLPIYNPYNDDGSYRLYNYYSTSDEEYKVVQRRFNYNKLPEREYDEDYQNTNTMEGNITLTYSTPIKGLTLESKSNANLISIYESKYSSRRSLSGMNSQDSSLSGYSGRYGVFDRRLKQNLQANYANSFHSWEHYHTVTAVLGAEFIDSIHPYLQATGNGFSNDYLREIALANQSTRKGTSGTSHSRSLSYLFLADYTVDNRYTLTLTGRRQGNSAFSKYAMWNNYGAVAVRWNLHRESFFNLPFINLFSVRMSYGLNGNSRVDSSSPYGTYSYSGSYGQTPAATLSTPANPDLSWETTYTTNPGLNLGLFKGRVSIDVDYYNRSTHHLIYSGRVSSVITDGNVQRNIGRIVNKGWEIVINTVNVQNDNFTWRTYFNGSRNRNLIAELDGDNYTGFFDHIWIEGQQKDAMWLIPFAGVDPVNGKRMYYDSNGDLTYTANFENREYMPQYSSQPFLHGGVSNSFDFLKHWNAQIMFDYRLGGWTTHTLIYDASSIDSNLPVELLDHWKGPGDAASVPYLQYNKGNTLADYNSTYDLWNTTYFQLRSVSIGYSIPERYVSKLGLKSCSVSFIGNNLYLLTPGQSSKHNSYKTIRDPYGMHRTFSAAVHVSF